MNKNEKLMDAINDIDDKYIAEAHAPVRKAEWKSWFSWKKLGILAVGVCVLFMLVPNFLRGFSHDYKYASETTMAYDAKPMAGGYAASTSNGYLMESAAAAEESYYGDYDSMESFSTATASGTFEIPDMQNRKLIVTANGTLETMEFDDTIADLEARIAAYGGYIQSSSVSTYGSTRSYDATIRIPADQYQAFADETKASGNMTYYSQSVEDITTEYADLDARIKSLEAEEARIMEFYKQAENLTELMEIEDRITEIRYQIDTLTSRKKNYDLVTSYSTLYLTVNETKAYTPVETGFGIRLSKALTNGWNNFVWSVEDFVIDVTYNLTQIVILAAAAVIGVLVYRRIKHRKK